MRQEKKNTDVIIITLNRKKQNALRVKQKNKENVYKKFFLESFIAVVFNLFRTVAHFLTQGNFTTSDEIQNFKNRFSFVSYLLTTGSLTSADYGIDKKIA